MRSLVKGKRGRPTRERNPRSPSPPPRVRLPSPVRSRSPPPISADVLENANIVADSARFQYLLLADAPRIGEKCEKDQWKDMLCEYMQRAEEPNAKVDFSDWHGASAKQRSEYEHPLHAWVNVTAYFLRYPSAEGAGFTFSERLFKILVDKRFGGSNALNLYPNLLLHAARTSATALEILIGSPVKLPDIAFEYCDPEDGATMALTAQMALTSPENDLDKRCAIIVSLMNPNVLYAARTGTKTGCPSHLIGCDLLTLALYGAPPRPLTARALMDFVGAICMRFPQQTWFDTLKVPTSTTCTDLGQLRAEAAARRDYLCRPKIARDILVAAPCATKPLMVPPVANLVCGYLGGV